MVNATAPGQQFGCFEPNSRQRRLRDPAEAIVVRDSFLEPVPMSNQLDYAVSATGDG